jgi:hypothetical protein
VTRQLQTPEERIDVDEEGCRHAGCLPWLIVAGAANDRPNDVRTVTALIEVFSLLVGPLAMIPLYVFLSSRIIARTPADCWPPSAAK